MDYIIEDNILVEVTDREKEKANFAKRVKALRKYLGMTQQQFGDYFDIPKRTIQDWEGGKRRIPAYLLKLMEYKVENESKTKSHNEVKK